MVNFTNALYLHADAFLISFYRLTGVTLLDYFIGTTILALIAVVIGEFTMSLSFRVNRRHIEEGTEEMVKMNNLSVKALMGGNKTGYTACNKMANESFGKQFFLMIALSTASLWPACFALAWMHSRFAAVTFRLPFPLPLFGQTVGYAFTFIPIYICVRIVFGKLKRYLPYFKQLKKITDSYDKKRTKMIPFPGFSPEDR
jgi:hypothetical protein